MSTSKRAVARRRGRVIAPNGVPVTEARVLKSRMRGNSHVRFGSGGGAGDRPTDRNAADTLRSLRSLRVRLNRRPLARQPIGGHQIRRE